MVALAAGAAVLLFIGGLAYLIGSGSSGETEPVDQPVTTVVPDPETGLEGSFTLSDLLSGWVATPDNNALLADVATDGRTVVAVGEGRVWVAEADGSNWTPVLDEDAMFGHNLTAVVAGGPGFVSVGNILEGDEFHAGIWVSADGFNWDRTFVEPEGSWVTDVTTGPSGLVAVGRELMATNQRPAIWTSPDGWSWSRIELEQPADPNMSLEAVISTDRGYLAVGGVVWASEDIVTWTRLAEMGDLGGGGMQDVTVGGPGLVAVGSEWDRDQEKTIPVVWTSVDGDTWTRTTLEQEKAAFLASVTALRGFLIAAGFEGSCGAGDQESVAFVSESGTAWSPIGGKEEGFGGSIISSVLETDTNLIAVGSNIWVWTPPADRQTVNSGQPPAVGC